MKGITPILAAVLMISIAVVLATLVMGWTTDFAKGQTTLIANKTSTITNCGDVLIDSVYLDFTDNVTRVIVRSISEDSEITSASVLSSDGKSLDNMSEIPVIIRNGQTTTLQFNMINNITTCGEFGEASVATTCSSDKFRQKATNC